MSAERPAPPGQLSDRMAVTELDKDILQLIIVGKSDRQIGEILGRSAKTINYHVERLKNRFGVATRLQLVICLVRTGQLEPECF